MKSERGFTLIELLAVIVILAIIAIIAVPIVMNIITSVRESSDRISFENYAKSVELAIMEYELYNDGKIVNSFEQLEEYIKYDGNVIDCNGKVIINSELYLTDCSIEGRKIKDEEGKNYTYGKNKFEYADYSDEEIMSNEYIYGIGATNRNDVVAIFNDDYTSVTIMNNAENSDGKIMDWKRGNQSYSQGSATYNGLYYQDSDKAVYTEVNPFYLYRGRLTEVIIKYGITRIGNYTFNYCTNLTGKLYIPYGVESIGQAAFQRCSGLTGDLYLPETIKDLGQYAFSKVSGFKGTLHISGNMTEIKSSTFRDTLFSNVYLPDSITSIESNAFYNNYNLKGDIILKSNVEIDWTSFLGNYSLNSLIKEGNEVKTTANKPNIKFYSQNDSRWAKKALGTTGSTYGANGCLSSTSAIIYSTLTDTETTPEDIVSWATDYGITGTNIQKGEILLDYVVKKLVEAGKNYKLVDYISVTEEEVNNASSYYKLVHEFTLEEKKKILNVLENDGYVFLSAVTGDTKSHSILLYGVDNKGNVYIADPEFASANEGVVDLDIILQKVAQVRFVEKEL